MNTIVIAANKKEITIGRHQLKTAKQAIRLQKLKIAADTKDYIEMSLALEKCNKNTEKTFT